LRFAARFFYEKLTRSEGGKPALAYLQRRGFTAETIKKFGLGYAPDAWDALLKAAEDNHITAETLEKAGLVIPRKDGSGYYDRYRARVIFPIFSHVGKVLGFGGRILASDTDQPKYINSPETEVYHKSRVLYGLYQAKQQIRKSEEVILVEGYTDVISLYQAGVCNAVASSGTALTVDQVKALGRYAKRVLLLYDADAAGANAALRGIDLILEQGLSAYAVALPAGEDPDSYVRDHGGPAFEDYAREHRQDFVAFKYALARRSGALDTPEGTAEVQRDIIASVARIPDPLMQASYQRRASEVMDVPEGQVDRVRQALLKDHERQARRSYEREARLAPPEARAPDAQPARPPTAAEAALLRATVIPPTDPLPEVKILIRLMLEEGKPLVEYILTKMAEVEFTPGPAREVVSGLVGMYQEGKIDANRFLASPYGAGVQRLVAEVLTDRHQPSENWERRQNITVPRMNEEPYKAAASAMTFLKLDHIDLAIRSIQEEIRRADQNGAELRPLQEQMMFRFRERKDIEQGVFLNDAKG
jgi:DNA primase